MSETEDGVSAADRADLEPRHAEGDSVSFDDLPDGSGCTEIWDYLSERRRD